MALIFLGKVGAPKKVLPNVPFTIKWNTWTLKWPWEKVNVFIKVNKNGETMYLHREPFTSLSFIKVLGTKYQDRLIEDSEYNIQAGYYE